MDHLINKTVFYFLLKRLILRVKTSKRSTTIFVIDDCPKTTTTTTPSINNFKYLQIRMPLLFGGFRRANFFKSWGRCGCQCDQMARFAKVEISVTRWIYLPKMISVWHRWLNLPKVEISVFRWLDYLFIILLFGHCQQWKIAQWLTKVSLKSETSIFSNVAEFR